MANYPEIARFSEVELVTFYKRLKINTILILYLEDEFWHQKISFYGWFKP